jgi:hypothetical protein
MVTRHPRARIWLTAVLVVVTLFWVFDLGWLRAGVPNRLDDTWEYGVAARHLLSGDGFRTSVIHPPLWGLRDAALTVPLLVHGPLVPGLLAPVLVLFGAGALDRIAWFGAFFALSTALLLCRLGTRHFGPAVGAAAALLFTLAPLTLQAVHHDATLVVGAFLLLLAFDLLARDRPRPTAAAIVLGLGVLVRTEMTLALFGLSMLAGGAGAVTLVLGMTMVAGAWWWHNWNFAGSPLFSLSTYLLVGYSERWPGISVLRDFSLTPAQWPRVFLDSTPDLLHKAQANLRHTLKIAILVPSALTGWLAAVGLVVGAARASTRWIAIAAFVCALVPMTVIAFTLLDTRYITPFLPLWALSAAVAAEWLWGRIPRIGRTPGWPLVLTLLMLFATVPALQRGAREAREFAALLAAERAALASRVTPAATLPRLTPLGLERPSGVASTAPRLMFSDTPDFVAWTTGRPTVWVSHDEYTRLPAPGTAVSADSPPPRGTSADTWFHEELR